MNRTWTDQDLRQAHASASTMAELITALGLKPTGGNFKHIRQHLERCELPLLDPSCVGIRQYNGKYSDEEVYRENSEYRGDLRKRLITGGLKAARCEKCGLDEWNGLPIPLEVDHVNGISNDNRVDNLMILCPNCHAQTPTYRGRNYKGRRKVIRSCVACGDDLSNGTSGSHCSKCFQRPRKIKWPTKQELLDRLKTTSYTQLGKELGVSDNAIRKHLARQT